MSSSLLGTPEEENLSKVNCWGFLHVEFDSCAPFVWLQESLICEVFHQVLSSMSSGVWVMQHFLKTCSNTVSGVFFQDTDTHFANFNAYVLAQPFFWLTTIVRYILILEMLKCEKMCILEWKKYGIIPSWICIMHDAYWRLCDTLP